MANVNPNYPPNYGRRSPDMFTVVLTSVITSTVICLLVLFLTGNLSLSPKPKQGPPPIAQAPQSHPVPSLVGMPVKSARDLLKTRKLRMVVKAERPDKAEAGNIIEQEPLPDSELETGGEVQVVVSSGIKRITVPKVVGKSLEAATESLKAGGIEIGGVEHTGDGQPGMVTQVTPATGTLISENTKVSLVVAPNDLEVPEVSGMRIGKARQTIKQSGFKVGKVRWRYNEYKPANIVLGQNPKAGTRVEPGTEINLIVNEE